MSENSRQHLLNRFRKLSADINNQIASGDFQKLSRDRQKGLISLLKELYFRLVGIFRKRQLVRILAGAGFLLGVAGTPAVHGQAVGFRPKLTNPWGLDSTQYLNLPVAADLDNDGDLDILTTEYVTFWKYFENTGTAGSPAFAAPQTNSFGLDSSYVNYFTFPTLGDIDADGDLDILGTVYAGNFEFFENTGTASSPSFAAAVQNPFGLNNIYQFGAPQLIDLDDDGDLDILANEYGGAWLYYENTGTAASPAFGTPQVNPFGLTAGTYYLLHDLADLDGDGDLDILYSEYKTPFAYQENIGTATNPSFDARVNNAFGLDSLFYFGMPEFADMDNDGDMDLLVGEYYGAFLYYENTRISVSTDPVFTRRDISISPNPASDRIVIDLSNAGISGFSELVITDLSGRVLMTQPVDRQQFLEINIRQLPAGTYLARLEGGKIPMVKRFVRQ